MCIAYNPCSRFVGLSPRTKFFSTPELPECDEHTLQRLIHALKLPQACRQIYAEAQPLLFRLNEFEGCADSLIHVFQDYFVHQPAAAQIANLSMTLLTTWGTKLIEAVTEPCHPLPVLLSLLQNLSNLKHVHVMFIGHKKSKVFGNDLIEMELGQEVQRRLEIRARDRKIEIKVTDLSTQRTFFV